MNILLFNNYGLAFRVFLLISTSREKYARLKIEQGLLR